MHNARQGQPAAKRAIVTAHAAALAVAWLSLAALAGVTTQQRFPLKQDLEPGQTGDGLIHESGDVAVRVTTAGLIVVDDKFPCRRSIKRGRA